jgi:hypothetical protein
MHGGYVQNAVQIIPKTRIVRIVRKISIFPKTRAPYDFVSMQTTISKVL